MQYYLPDGEWINLLDDRHVKGSHWQKEQHDFLSLPLMVRPGTVLPLGKCDSRPDYDYTDGIELNAYGLKEGQTVTVSVPDIKGNVAAVYTVSVKDGKCAVTTTSDKPYSLIVH